jgi:hypothetical protein
MSIYLYLNSWNCNRSNHTSTLDGSTRKLSRRLSSGLDLIFNRLLTGIQNLTLSHRTMELTYESATSKVSSRLLPYIDLEAIQVAYLGDNIYICPKRPTDRHANRSKEREVWIVELFEDPYGIQIRKSEILDILRQTRKNDTQSILQEFLDSFTCSGVLLADPASGMVAKMSDNNIIFLFTFWSTSRFYNDRNDNDATS